MRMIICDMCKKEIKDHKKIRQLTCSRHLPHTPADLEEWREDGTSRPVPKTEVMWFKEICSDCALALEEYISSQAADGEAGSEQEGEDDSSDPGIGG